VHLLDLLEAHALKRDKLRHLISGSGYAPRLMLADRPPLAARPVVANVHAYSNILGAASGSSWQQPAPAALPWVPANKALPVCTLFRGRLQSSVECRSCGHVSRTFDPFETLSLEIAGCRTVEECLRRFFSSEVLDNDNKYRCNGCKALVCAEKRLAMSTAPELRA